MGPGYQSVPGTQLIEADIQRGPLKQEAGSKIRIHLFNLGLRAGAAEER